MFFAVGGDEFAGNFHILHQRMVGDVDGRVLNCAAVGENFPFDGANVIPTVGTVQFYGADIGDYQRIRAGVISLSEIFFFWSRGEFCKRQRFGSGFKLGKGGFCLEVVCRSQFRGIDGKKVFDVPTNVPFTLIDKTKLFIENRKGIEGFSFGVHTITLKAVKAPVTLMGVYSYDTRSNDRNLRSVYGNVCDGEYTFVPAFKATPIIQTSGSLKVKSVTSEKAVFTGSGYFAATGE